MLSPNVLCDVMGVNGFWLFALCALAYGWFFRELRFHGRLLDQQKTHVKQIEDMAESYKTALDRNKADYEQRLSEVMEAKLHVLGRHRSQEPTLKN